MPEIELEELFDLNEALASLENTPNTLGDLLANLPDSWLDFREDPEAWSPRRVLIHFIHNEHPALGTVNLRQLISTWVVHDFNHLHQIAKSLAKRYTHEVGPWRPNLAIIDA